MINVLALDASLRSTGWATAVTTPDGITRHHHGHLTPRTHNGRRWTPLKGPERLAWIAAHTRALARQHDTQLVAIEGPSFASKSRSTDEIGGLHWIIRVTLWGAGIPYIVVAPATLKRWATGSGRADKHQMLAAARDLCGYTGTSNDEADAVLLLAMAHDAIGTPTVQVPDEQRDGLQALVQQLPKEGIQ